MTKEEILQKCTWDSYDTATILVHSEFFDKEIEVNFRPEFKKGRIISDKMVECLNDFLTLSKNHASKIKELLYKHCELCFDVTSYEHVQIQENETETEATRRTFGIFNQEDAYLKSNVESIGIDMENDNYANRYVEILFYPEWEDEHGCNIILQNGKPIDYQESMPHMGQYEKER